MGENLIRRLTGFISSELKKQGLEAILVDGACVTIYTEETSKKCDLLSLEAHIVRYELL